MAELRSTLLGCVERAAKYRQSGSRLGEQNTKASLIEPVLRALGWDVFDAAEVHREFRRRTVDSPVDYALLVGGLPRFFIEAKALGENVGDPRWANQTIGYAAVAGVKWVVLTNGVEWRIYNSHAPVPSEEKLLRSVSIEADLDGAERTLRLLAKESLAEDGLDALWAGDFADAQVSKELGLLLGPPAQADLVALLARRLPNLSRRAIEATLARLSVHLEVADAVAVQRPAVGLDYAPPRPGPTAATSAQRLQPRDSGASLGVGSAPRAEVRHVTSRRVVSSEERRLNLADLLAMGRLTPGRLHATYFGTTFEAELTADAVVRFRGERAQSLSHAGRLAKVAYHGQDLGDSVTATDGWDFWSTRDAQRGDVVTLKEIRRRAAHGS